MSGWGTVYEMERAKALGQDPDSLRREIERLRGLVESFELILTECENDFHRCERCDYQDDGATKESDLFLLLRAAIKEQGGSGGHQQRTEGKA